MKYLDTNVFLFAFSGSQHAQTILKEVSSGRMDGATSCLSWDEFMWALRKQFSEQDSASEGKKLLSCPHLVFLDVNVETIERAQQLLERYGLRPRDAIHAASALQRGIREMISDDSDFDRVKEFKRVPIDNAVRA